MWYDVLLAAIGENISNCAGVRAINKSNRLRKLFKIEVWMDTVEHNKVQHTRRELKNVINDDTKFSLMLHQDKHQQACDYENTRRQQQHQQHPPHHHRIGNKRNNNHHYGADDMEV